ncbi:elongation factor Ts [Parvularcula sp. ZS-1/3]|uniref:Elongation factor Ts n=1 Tax=Parvularcula mediterranea TaxID=2732508 RepID=A0A7Y3RN87_9PROT|nr:translation elongation factor Ts [Parvularcula mediterranea]NNU16706.1 elongation factor Ts [Parvularcula mediterranea]
MAEITAKMVKQLRDMTGAGMMDAKKALVENGGDVDAAVDWLRTKGLAKAAKKAGRTAADGLVAFAIDGTKGALVEVNAETDFVARNEKFQEMVRNIADTALTVDGDTAKLREASYPGTDKTVDGFVAEMVGQIGENMALRRSEGISVEKGAVVPYLHTQIADRSGKIGVIVALESDKDASELQEVGKQLAMHIAAARPQALNIDGLDQAVVQREKDVLSEQARASGKPDNIIEKMVEGRIRKFYEESVLLEQIFVIDGETKVKDVAKNAGAELKGYVRFELGDGIEKEEEDFAAEVASLSKG